MSRQSITTYDISHIFDQERQQQMSKLRQLRKEQRENAYQIAYLPKIFEPSKWQIHQEKKRQEWIKNIRENTNISNKQQALAKKRERELKASRYEKRQNIHNIASLFQPQKRQYKRKGQGMFQNIKKRFKSQSPTRKQNIIRDKPLLLYRDRSASLHRVYKTVQLQNDYDVPKQQFNSRLVKQFKKNLLRVMRFKTNGLLTLQDFYKAIISQIQQQNKYGENYQVTLYFSSFNKYAYRTFTKRDLASFDTFYAKIERMSKEIMPGSDQSELTNDMLLDYDIFELKFYKNTKLQDHKQTFYSIFYEFYDQRDDLNCLLQVQEQINIHYPLFQFSILEDIADISIFNASQILRQHNIIIEDYNKPHGFIQRDNYVQVPLQKPVCVIKDNHIQLVKKSQVFQLKDGYIVDEKQIMLFDRMETDCLLIKEPHIDTLTSQIATIDYETLFNAHSLNAIQPAQCSLQYKNKHAIFFGLDSGCKALQFLRDNNKQGEKITLQAYNAQKFDSYLLLSDIQKLKLRINSIFPKGNALMTLEFDDLISVWDPCVFTLCSLDDAGTNYDLKFKKKNIGQEVSFLEQQRYINDQIKQYNDEQSYQQTYHSFFHESECTRDYFEPIIFDFDPINQTTEQLESIIRKNCCNCKKFQDFCIYNAFDVLSCHELQKKLCQVVDPQLDRVRQNYLNANFEKRRKQAQMNDKTITEEDVCKTMTMLNFKTFASLAWWFQEKTVGADSSIYLQKLTLNQYKNIKGYSTAGRCQVFKGLKHQVVKIEGQYYVMVDIVSLYPWSYMNNWYPCGRIFNNMSFDYCQQQGRIGWFWVTFHQRNCFETVLPYRDPEGNKKHQKTIENDVNSIGEETDCPFDPKKQMKGLNWSCRCVQRQYLSSIEIVNLKRFGATIINIEKQDSIMFEGLIHGSKLFSVMQFFKQMKINEDELKEQKDPRYNPAQRGFSKNILNSISGKLLSKLYTETLKYFPDQDKLIKYIRKHYQTIETELDEDEFVQEQLEKADAGRIEGQTEGWFFKTEISEEEAIKKSFPVYLGSLIYTYARMKMNQIIQYGVLYMDTDSALMRIEDFNRFQQENGLLLGKEFGQFDFEPGTYDEKNKQGLITHFTLLAPKCYFMFNSENKLIKKGFKGIGIKSKDQNKCDKLIGENTLKLFGFYPHFVHETPSRAAHWEIRGNEQLKREEPHKFERLLFEMWLHCTDNNKSLNDQTNIDKFIDLQMKNKLTFILSSQLRKMKCSNLGEKQAFTIYQSYTIKCIQPLSE